MLAASPVEFTNQVKFAAVLKPVMLKLVSVPFRVVEFVVFKTLFMYKEEISDKLFLSTTVKLKFMLVGLLNTALFAGTSKFMLGPSGGILKI